MAASTSKKNDKRASSDVSEYRYSLMPSRETKGKCICKFISSILCISYNH